jgi:hypothetical protein
LQAGDAGPTATASKEPSLSTGHCAPTRRIEPSGAASVAGSTAAQRAPIVRVSVSARPSSQEARDCGLSGRRQAFRSLLAFSTHASTVATQRRAGRADG